MPQKVASTKQHKAAKPKSHLSFNDALPDKEFPHDRNSYSIYTFGAGVETCVRDVTLCIHDDFVVPESPVAVHLGYDSVSLGRPPPADTARQTYDIVPSGVLDEDEKEQHTNKRMKKHISQKEDHAVTCGDSLQNQPKRRKAHNTPFLLTPVTRLNANPQRRSFSFHSAIIALAVFAIFFLAPNRTQPMPEPVPEYTIIKPLDPGPDGSFIGLLQRHAMLPFAIVQSDATDTNIYKDLLWDVDEYCGELHLRLVADWVHVGAVTGRQLWPWWTRKHDTATFNGPAYERSMDLCDKFNTVLRPLAPEVVVPLHSFIVNYWGVHAVTAMLSAASGLAKLSAEHKNDMLLLDSPAASPMSHSENNDLDANRTRNASLAIAVLKELSSQVTLPRDWSALAIENIRTLNMTIDRVVTLGNELLEPTWKQWLAQNGLPETKIQENARTLSQKDLEHLSNLRNQAHAKLSVLKAVQTQFSGLATEALNITGSEVNKLKGSIDNLIAGRGWTEMVRDEEGRWAMDWFYFSIRTDLPGWVKQQALDITSQLRRLARK